MRIHKVFLLTMITSLSAAAIVGTMAIIFGASGWMGDILVTSLFTGLFSITSLMVVFSRKRVITITGIATSILALILFLILIWFKNFPYDEEYLVRPAFTFTVIACVLGPVSLIALLPQYSRPGRIIWLITRLLILLLSLTSIIFIWIESYATSLSVDVFFGRSIGALTILSAAGILITVLMWKLHSVKAGDHETIPRGVEIRLTCPRCGEEQDLAAGEGQCSRCGLKIRINIEEPRCSCGYLLFRLEGDRCPECGRRIEEKDRWVSPSLRAKTDKPVSG